MSIAVLIFLLLQLNNEESMVWDLNTFSIIIRFFMKISSIYFFNAVID